MLDEKFHREIELENELQINKDFTLELEHLQAVMSDNSALSVDKLQQHIEQLQSIKSIHIISIFITKWITNSSLC